MDDQDQKQIKDLLNKFTSSRDDKVNIFTSLLDDIQNLDDKKKQLWRQIYENALTDRQISFLLYTDLMTKVIGNENAHAIHGPNLSKYIERMSKANDQIIKLAELIAKAQEENESINSDDLFEKIKN